MMGLKGMLGGLHAQSAILLVTGKALHQGHSWNGPEAGLAFRGQVPFPWLGGGGGGL